VEKEELIDARQSETGQCCVGGDIAQTLKTIAEELQRPESVVSSDGGQAEGEPCECTESDLAATKETAQSMTRVPTETKVNIFRSVLDDVREFNEDLARDFRAQMLKKYRSEAKAAKHFFQYWREVIHSYPDAEKLKSLVEPSFQQYPELAAEWYQNIDRVAESFVR